MKIKPFGVEIWMNEFEMQCKYNLAETCVASLTVEELINLSGKGNSILEELLPMKLTYGEIEGSIRLRQSISTLYQNQTIENIVVTHGAIGANALVHEAMVSEGDHVISICPTYQQHYSIPESYGAEVEILWLKPENNFLPDLIELKSMLRSNTKLIVLNNPNNPTGALMMDEYLNNFIRKLREVGTKTFILHARKAMLSGLSPKQNLNIPPLKYERVYKLKEDFKDLEIIINGGITSTDQIKNHLSTVKIYGDKLINEKTISSEDLNNHIKKFKDLLSDQYKNAKNYKPKIEWFEGTWSRYKPRRGQDKRGDTGYSTAKLLEISDKIHSFSPELNIHKTIVKIFESRKNSMNNGNGIDWSTAEVLAFGLSLIHI